MATKVSATFDDPETATRAVRALLDQSVPRERIRVFLIEGADERQVAITQNNRVFRHSMFGAAIGTAIGFVALLLVVADVLPMPGMGFSETAWLAVVQGSGFGLLVGWITGVTVGLGVWSVDIETPKDHAKDRAKRATEIPLRIEVEPFQRRADAVRETLSRMGGKLTAEHPR